MSSCVRTQAAASAVHSAEARQDQGTQQHALVAFGVKSERSHGVLAPQS